MSATPVLASLQADLERAERALTCADMIDDNRRRLVEMACWKARINDIKQQITRIAEAF